MAVSQRARAQKKKPTTPAQKRTVKSARARPAVAVEDESYGDAPAPAESSTGIDRSSKRDGTRELTWAEFDAQVHALARAAKKFKPNAVVGIAHGGVFVGGAVASALSAEFFPVRITRRSRDTGTRTPPGISDDMPRELKGKRVLLVDDVAGSGDGLQMAARLAKAAGAKETMTCALIARPGGFAPDVSAFVTQTFFVFPWDYQSVVEDSRFDPDTSGA